MSKGKGRSGGWAARDEGRPQEPERPVAYIDHSRCDRAPGCPVSRICPKNAVVPDPGAPERPARSLFGFLSGTSRPGWAIDENKCSGCLLCARYCPHQAVLARTRTAG